MKSAYLKLDMQHSTLYENKEYVLQLQYIVVIQTTNMW